MKSILNYIYEHQSIKYSTINDYDHRISTEWKEGDKVLLMKYDGDMRWALCWGIETIKKVNDDSIIIDTDNTVVNKFDSNGIFQLHSRRRYSGYDCYFVLYNADLISKSSDIKGLKNNSETEYYSFPTDDNGTEKKRFIEALKKFK